jgi:hypothetical protein
MIVRYQTTEERMIETTRSLLQALQLRKSAARNDLVRVYVERLMRGYLNLERDEEFFARQREMQSNARRA